MNYIVESRFYDDGRIEARIYENYDPVRACGFIKTRCCDRYIDVFASLKEAETFYKDTLEA